MRTVSTQAEVMVAALYAALKARYGAKFQQADIGVRLYGQENETTSNMLVCGDDADVVDAVDLGEAVFRAPQKGAVVLDVYVYLGDEDDYGLQGNVDAFILDGKVLGLACPFVDKAAHAALTAKQQGVEVLP